MSDLSHVKRQFATVRDFKDLFASDKGRRVLYKLMSHGHLLSPSWNKDPYQHAFNSGQRDTVMFILTTMKTNMRDLEKYIEGANDHASREY